MTIDIDFSQISLESYDSTRNSFLSCFPYVVLKNKDTVVAVDTSTLRKTIALKI